MMGLEEYARQIRELADDYYHRRITMEEYYKERQQLLDEIDLIFNKSLDTDDSALLTNDKVDADDISILE